MGAGQYRPAQRLVTHDPLRSMLGDEAVPASVAGPEIADDVFRQIGGRFSSNHGVSTHWAGRQITPPRIGARRGGRQDFSDSWHHDPLRS